MFSVPIAALEENPKVIPLLNSINFWLGPAGCVVTGPMETDSGPQMSLEFVILGENRGSEGNWDKEIDIDHVRHFFRSWDPVLSEMLAHTEKAHVWRLAYTDPELEWVSNSGKVVLIGDAAHAVLPHTGAVSLLRQISLKHTDTMNREQLCRLRMVRRWQNVSHERQQLQRSRKAPGHSKRSESLGSLTSRMRASREQARGIYQTAQHSRTETAR